MTFIISHSMNIQDALRQRSQFASLRCRVHDDRNPGYSTIKAMMSHNELLKLSNFLPICIEHRGERKCNTKLDGNISIDVPQKSVLVGQVTNCVVFPGTEESSFMPY